MTDRVRSTKEAQLRLSRELRAEGKTWVEVAAIFRSKYRLNARMAFRVAHGWSQADAANHWNNRWPSDAKTFKNFSYWEQWPNATGYAPSLSVLSRLADLYECAVTDLLVDFDNFRHRDPVHRNRTDLERLPRALRTSGPSDTGVVATDNDSKATDDLAGFMKRLRDSDAEELATVAAQWARQADPSNDRRSLLLKLSFALTLAASSQAASPDQQPAAQPTIFGNTDLSGIWRSEYSYYSTSRQKTFSDVHYVHVQQSGQQIMIKSLNNATGSEISLDLALDGFYATGAWQERTSQAGYYKGAVYRVAIQQLVSPSLNQMAGKWLGFGKNFTINNGDWQFTLETRSTTDQTINEYKMKVLDI